MTSTSAIGPTRSAPLIRRTVRNLTRRSPRILHRHHAVRRVRDTGRLGATRRLGPSFRTRQQSSVASVVSTHTVLAEKSPLTLFNWKKYVPESSPFQSPVL